MAIYAIHGFLGTAADWVGLFPLAKKIHAPNLFSHSCSDNAPSFMEWAASFNGAINNPENTLVGYSMGGRLALHALIQNPKLWKAAIVISANPGIENETDKIEKLKADALWHDRFLNEPWDALMDSWNQQPIFAGSSILRRESEYSRTALANAMAQWSIGKQEFLKPQIEELDIPILWIAGEHDKKYVAIAKSMKFKNSRSKISIAPQAGHRVPWQQKLWFQQEVEEFL